jgi:hypothetical protein
MGREGREGGEPSAGFEHRAIMVRAPILYELVLQRMK